MRDHFRHDMANLLPFHGSQNRDFLAPSSVRTLVDCGKRLQRNGYMLVPAEAT